MNSFAVLLQPVLLPFSAQTLMGKEALIGLPRAESRGLADILYDEAFCRQQIRMMSQKFSLTDHNVASLLWQKQFVRGFLGQWLAQALFGESVATKLEDFYVDAVHLKGLQWLKSEILGEYQVAMVLTEFAQEIVSAFSVYGIHHTDSWGNIALAVADPWMKARQWVSDIESLANSHAMFVRYLPVPLQSAMLLLPYTQSNGEMALHFRRRRSCCHKYEVPNKAHCSTCSKVPLEKQLSALISD